MRYKEPIQVALSRGINVISGFGILYLLTRDLPKESYGIWVLMMAIPGLFNQFILGGLTNAVIRYYHIYREKNESNTLVLNSIFVLILGFICFVILFTLFNSFATWFSIRYLLLALLFAFVNGLFRLLVSINNASRNREKNVYGNFFMEITKLTILSVFGKSMNLELLLLVYLVSNLLVIIYFSRPFSLLDPNNFKIDRALINKLVKFTIPFTIWGFFVGFFYASDRLFINIFYDSELVAEYGFIYQLGYVPTNLFMMMLATYAAPILYQLHGDGTDSIAQLKASNYLKRILGYGVIISILVFAFYFFFSHGIVRFLFTSQKEYFGSLHLLPWLSLSASASGIINLFFQKDLANFELKKLLIINICSGFLGVVSSFVLIYYIEISGAVLALMTFPLFQFAFYRYFMIKSRKEFYIW